MSGPEPSPALDSQTVYAYAICRDIARSAAKNFYFAFLALPRDKRNALCAVYAFMRKADDIADNPGLPAEEKREHLDSWLKKLRVAAEGAATDDPIIIALVNAQQRFQIPFVLFEKLIFGSTLDVGDGSVIKYRSFDELYRYCYHVASVVGLVCIRIFGYHDARAEKLAEHCGIALQLTNIIRDVREDAALGRIYLPEEDLQRFGLSSESLATSNSQNGFHPGSLYPVLRLEADRAREFYKSAEELQPLIEKDSQAAFWILVEIYRRLLKKIARQGYTVFEKKVQLSLAEKLAVLLRGMVRHVSR